MLQKLKSLANPRDSDNTCSGDMTICSQTSADKCRAEPVVFADEPRTTASTVTRFLLLGFMVAWSQDLGQCTSADVNAQATNQRLTSHASANLDWVLDSKTVP